MRDLGSDSTNPITLGASSHTPLLTLALDQLHMQGEHGVDDEHTRGPGEAADVATLFQRRVQAPPEVILTPLGWKGLRVKEAPFQRLLRVRVDAPPLVFVARLPQIQRVLLRFSAAWRLAHPGLATESRPAVSVRRRRNDELGVGDSVAIVVVVENDTSDQQEAELRAELDREILANVDYIVQVERAAPST